MKIDYVDSHTAGEPTRVVTGGFPSLSGTMSERLAAFGQEWDHVRKGIVLEPRGSDVLVGALLTPPTEPGSDAGVIFFNNAGPLGMCGHGTIGVVETLRWMGRLEPDRWQLDTPVGTVSGTLQTTGDVSLDNVPSYRHLASVELDVPGVGHVKGDVAYGGNWFFLAKEPVLEIGPSKIAELTEVTRKIRHALTEAGITGADGAEIDHIELFCDSPNPGVDSRNFVLCPGYEFDRSPCGTGTSAKMACLLADGTVAEGQEWVQESVTGGIFHASGRWVDGKVVPTIRGRAHVVGNGTLHFDENDPYRWGLEKA